MGASDSAHDDQHAEATSPEVARLARLTTFSLIVLVLALPLVVWGAYGALLGLNDDAIGWTATNLPAKQDFHWFTRHFETPDSILVSWPGCTLDDPRLDHFARALPAQGPRDTAGGSRWFPRVMSGAETVRSMTEPPRNFSRREAVRRLTGVLVGPDGQTTCAIVVLSGEAAVNGRHVLQAIKEVAQRECGIAPDELRLTGHVVETTALDVASLETLYHLALPSALLTMLVAWPSLRSLRLAMVVLLGAIFCQCCSLALVYYSGREMNGMMGVLPMLVLGCFVSGAIQLNNYHLESLPQAGPRIAAWRGVVLAWSPCLLAVATTAIGVGSLATSHVQPVYRFGVYGGIAILIVYVVLFLVMPGGMAWTSHGEYRRRRPVEGAVRRNPLGLSWRPLAALVGNHSTWVLVVFGCGLAIGSVGVRGLRGSLQLIDFFPEQSRTTRDHRWLESNIGPLMPLEIVLGFDRDSPRTMLDRLGVVEQVEQVIRDRQTLASTLSLATFLPRPNRTGSARGTIQRSVFNSRLQREAAELGASTCYLAEADGKQWWRITARLESLDRRSYEDIVAEIRLAVTRSLAGPEGKLPPDLALVWTGMLPLLAESYPVLLRDLIVSFTTSFFWNSLVLAIGFRSIRLGLISIFPNAFPIVLVFGAMGWFRMAVDPGTMMTASVGLGIAVDNGVHYLTWFTRGLRQGLSQPEAILHAYERCGKAMFRSAAICVGGMIVYTTSSFVPAARFGWLVCVLFAAALVGDLIFLPALVAGRLGRLLLPRQVMESSGTEESRSGN